MATVSSERLSFFLKDVQTCYGMISIAASGVHIKTPMEIRTSTQIQVFNLLSKAIDFLDKVKIEACLSPVMEHGM